MKEQIFIAMICNFPELLSIYGKFLRKVKFESLLGEVIDSIMKSYELFGGIQVSFLKEKFDGRDDLNLFMKEVSEQRVDNDIAYAKYWVGSYLSNRIKESIDKDSESVGGIKNKALIAEELERIAVGKDIQTVDVWDFAAESDKRLEYQNLDKFVVKTGMAKLDEQVKMADGTVSVFLAPYKRYKSIILINMGAVALAQGMSVFHVHYEGKKELWETRYDACLTGISKDRLYKGMTDGEKDRYKKIYDNIKKKGSKIYFMSAAPNITGVVEIENHLNLLRKEGIEFQVVIIDYLNLLKSSTNHRDSDWLEQGDQVWDIVRLSQKGYSVITAAQSKTSGIDREILRSQDLGRTIIIPQAITNLIAINQTPTEKEQGVIRLSPLLARDGETLETSTLEMSLWKMRISKDVDRVIDGAFYGEEEVINTW